MFSQLSTFAADCLRHLIQMVGGETVCELHTQILGFYSVHTMVIIACSLMHAVVTSFKDARSMMVCMGSFLGCLMQLANIQDITSLVPKPPPFFVLRFAFSIIHGSGRA